MRTAPSRSRCSCLLSSPSPSPSPHFTELRDAEVFQNRLESLDRVSNYVGEYFSKEWVQKNVLHLSDEDIENMNKEMEGEDDGEEQEVPNNSPTDGQKFELKPVQGDEKEDE